MADMDGFGEMDIEDRGGKHEFNYDDGNSIAASAGLTPSQTVGPFFAYGLTPGPYGYPHEDAVVASIAPNAATDDVIEIEGQLFDGEGQPIHDALIEIVQADGSGNYAREGRNDGFTGYGRCGTGPDGPASKGADTHFRFQTVKPGVSTPNAAPFITIIVMMRGLLNHCITRMYFPEDDHTSDPVMLQVREVRRATLIAAATGPNHYRFDIHMQGDNETVFFDI